MYPDSIEQIKNALLTECRVDYVGLWEVIVHAQYALKEDSPRKIREVVMEVLGELLLTDQIKAGDLNEQSEFLQWKLNPDRVIQRIDEQWSAWVMSLT